MNDLANASLMCLLLWMRSYKLRQKIWRPGWEHLRWGGETLHLWLQRVLNSIVEMEEIPYVQGRALTPSLQGRREGSFPCNNYCGITMNSVQVLEILVLLRMEESLAEAGFPHLN